MRRLAVAALCLFLLAAGWPAQAQSGGPRLTGVEALDLRGPSGLVPNGKLDALRLTFDAALDENTFFIEDFRVSGDRKILGYAMSSPSVVELWFREQSVFDTGDKPSITYSGNRLKGATGAPAAVTPPATLDKAPPVLVSVRATAGSDVLVARFSEPLSGSIQNSHFTYQDQNTAGASGLTGTPALAGDRVDLKLNAAATTSDLSGDRLAATADIKDAAGNAANLLPRTLASPRAIEARGQVGEDKVRVVFNVPVNAISSTEAFDVVYDSSPSDPIEGVKSVQGSGGSYEVLVTLTGKIKPSDVRSLEPARMQVLDGFLKEQSGGDIPFASVPFVDKQRPQVLGVFTQDRNRNGFIDAVAIQWDEPITPVCADGLAVEGFELDLQAGQTPFPSADGKQVTLTLKERVTGNPDTGHLPQFTMQVCSDGKVPFKDQAEPQNDAVLVAKGAVIEKDGANPSIVTATTQDEDADGKLDAYAFTFSEPMKATSDLSTWVIRGRNITSGAWTSTTELLIRFQEGKEGDTGELPDVDYTGDTYEDIAGNKLLKFEGGGFLKKDGAAPYVVGAFGDAGQKVIRLLFSEGVEGVTDPQNGGPGRGLQESDFHYTDSNADANGNNGIIGVRHSKGDRVAYLDTARPLLVSDFGPNGDKIQPLAQHIRESNNKAAGERISVAPQTLTLTEKDLDPPGALSGLAWTVGINNATLTFTAPADDGLAATSGNVTGYHVVVSNETLASITSAQVLAKAPYAKATLSPTPPGAVATTQTVTLEGLCPSTPYHVALVAVDEDNNPSPVAIPPSITTAKDTTPPIGPVTFVSTDYLQNATGPVPSSALDGRIAWEGFTDAESCSLSYRWRLDDHDTAAPGPTDNATQTPGAVLDLPRDMDLPADLWLSVVALNGDQVPSEPFRYALRIVAPAACAPDAATVDGLQAVYKEGFTTLTWDTFSRPLPDGVTLEGYQVWVRHGTTGAWTLRDVLTAPFSGFGTQKYIDDAPRDRAHDYLVTAYFTDGLCRIKVDAKQEAAQDMSGFTPTAVEIVEPPATVPTWAWVTLLAISLVVVGGVVTFYGMRRTRLDESWLEDDDELPDPDNPFGPDPITDLTEGEHNVEDDPFADGQEAGPPTLDIVCPACTHQFQATGHRPLPITCPNCHANGVLE